MEKNHNGRWTPAQHHMFLQGLQIYGKNWKKIQQLIGTRTGCQIRSHAQKFFLKHRDISHEGDSQCRTKLKQLSNKDVTVEQQLSADDQSSSHMQRDTEISYLQIHLSRFKPRTQQSSSQSELLNFWNNYIDMPTKAIRKASVDSVALQSSQNTHLQAAVKTCSFVPFMPTSTLIERMQGLKKLN